MFSYIALALFLPGALLLLRAAYVFIGRRVSEISADNLQALVVGSILVLMALITFLIGLLADLVGGVRRVQQELLYRVRAMEAENGAWRRTMSERLGEGDHEGHESLGEQPEREEVKARTARV